MKIKKLFGVLLSYLAWTSVCTMFRGYFRGVVSRRIALAGFLMLVSDTAVAHSLFNPVFAGQFAPLLLNVIWAAYVPAWTLIAVIIAEGKLLA